MYLVSNRVTTGAGIALAFENCALLTFSGNMPDTLEDLPFDLNSISDAIVNCESMYFLQVNVNPDYRAQSLAFYERHPLSTSSGYQNLQACFQPKQQTGNVLVNKYTLPAVMYVSGVDALAKESEVIKGTFLGNTDLGDRKTRNSANSASEYNRTWQHDVTNKQILIDFGKVRNVDHIEISYYMGGVSVCPSEEFLLEFWNETSGEWEKYSDLNINSRVSRAEDYQTESIGSYSEYWDDRNIVTLARTVVARKLRIQINPTSTATLNTKALNFFTDDDLSAEIKPVENNWGILVPFGSLTNPLDTFAFKVIPIGQDGEATSLTPFHIRDLGNGKFDFTKLQLHVGEL